MLWAEGPAFLRSVYGATVKVSLILGSPGGAIVAAALGAPVLTGWADISSQSLVSVNGSEFGVRTQVRHLAMVLEAYPEKATISRWTKWQLEEGTARSTSLLVKYLRH